MAKINCLTPENTGERLNSKKIRVKIIKAPIVNTDELRRIICARARALVL